MTRFLWGGGKRRSLIIAAIVIVAVSFLAFIAVHSGPTIDPRPVSERDHVKGGDAPVTLIVYTDFDCPFCKIFHEDQLPALQHLYGDSIRIVYRHFPLPIHPGARRAAEAAECAYTIGGDEAFWDFADAAYMNLREGGITDVSVRAGTIGLDMAAFDTCMQEERGSARVQADSIEGKRIGIRLTPSIVVVGKDHSELVAGNNATQIMVAIDYITESER